MDEKWQDRGHSYQELIKAFGNTKSGNRIDVERALDKLLDSGIFTAGWERREGENKWNRKFYNRGDISAYFKDFSPYAKGDYLAQASKVDLYDISLKLSERMSNLPESLKNTLDEINHYAHAHIYKEKGALSVKGEFERKIPYEDIWKAMLEIKDCLPGSEFYESDIRYYNPHMKKIGICNLPCDKWASLSFDQCKMRLIFSMDVNGNADEVIIFPDFSTEIEEDKKALYLKIGMISAQLLGMFLNGYFLPNETIRNYNFIVGEYNSGDLEPNYNIQRLPKFLQNEFLYGSRYKFYKPDEIPSHSLTEEHKF